MLAKRINPILNVPNIVKSFAWFEKLGWKKDWEWGGGRGKSQAAQREMHVRHPDGHVFRLRQERKSS